MQFILQMIQGEIALFGVRHVEGGDDRLFDLRTGKTLALRTEFIQIDTVGVDLATPHMDAEDLATGLGTR